MLVTDALAVAFLLLYFWYMTWSPTTAVAQPSTPYRSPQVIPLDYHLSTRGDQLLVSIGQDTWTTPMPDHYTVVHDKIVPQDACYGQPDGAQVAATGRDLYQWLQEDKLKTTAAPFERDASALLQAKHIYYYTCRSGQVEQLHQCPPGTLFQRDRCESINPCTGQPNKALLPVPYDATKYYLCHHEKAREVSCPANEIFVHNKCQPMDDAYYCQHHTEPFIKDPHTLLVCQNNQVTYETCSPGFQYFDTPKCEPTPCVGKPDGTRLPMPTGTLGSIRYSPGYMTCRNGRVDHTEVCPSQWDRYLGDRLPFLPQVFDGTRCAIPELCTNVMPENEDVIVPVHIFTKHLRNWAQSYLFDEVVGYKCEGKTRKRVALEPGTRISKRLRVEPSCDGKKTAVIPDEFEAYFDCRTLKRVPCPKDHFFNGTECQQRLPHAFQYKGLDMFSMEGLSDHNWIKPWDYLPVDQILPHCTEAHYVLNKTYNVCIHPDCVQYPFLSQIKFKVGHKDGSECVFDPSTRRIDKQTTSNHYLFWSQRSVPDPTQEDACTVGGQLKTGNFVLDQTIYTTCDASQPFVFCPSKDTGGVSKLVTKWACEPMHSTFEIPPRSKREYTKHEVLNIKPKTMPTHVKVNGLDVGLLKSGMYVSHMGVKLETLDKGVVVHIKRFVTHPPDVVFNHDGTKEEGKGAYLMKLANFSQKPMNLPFYEPKPSVPNFFV